jgi:hypothetical protein|tara:strand:+ start:1467 stop:1691 length:225 start_codon:yes stop_codon:yes gene_type:complete
VANKEAVYQITDNEEPDVEWNTWCEKYKLEWEEYEKQELEKLKEETRVLYFKLFRALLAVIIFAILLIWWGNSD